MSQQLREYTVTNTFQLGQTGQNVERGQTILWDGYGIVEIDGQQLREPKMRGAAKMGWLVPSESFDPGDFTATIPRPAGMSMRPSDGGNPLNPTNRHIPQVVPSAQDRSVMNVAEHSSQTAAINVNPPRGLRAAQPGNYRGMGTAYHGGNFVGGNSVDAAQVSVVDRTFQSPAKSSTDFTKVSPGEALARAESVKIQTRPGLTREQMLSQLVPEEQQAYLADTASLSSGHYDQPVQVVANVRKPSRSGETEGIQYQTTTSGGAVIQDGSAMSHGGKPDVQVVESEGILFTNTNGPKKDVTPVAAPPVPVAAPPVAEVSISSTDAAVRKSIAKRMCEDFPEIYDFTVPEKKRLSRVIADFEDRPDVILAIYSAETDSMKSKLVAEFPQAFA